MRRSPLVAHLRSEIGVVGFWQNPYAQDVLRKWVVQHLDGQQVDGHDLFKLDRLSELADRVVELATRQPCEAGGSAHEQHGCRLCRRDSPSPVSTSRSSSPVRGARSVSPSIAMAR